MTGTCSICGLVISSFEPPVVVGLSELELSKQRLAALAYLGQDGYNHMVQNHPQQSGEIAGWCQAVSHAGAFSFLSSSDPAYKGGVEMLRGTIARVFAVPLEPVSPIATS